METVKINFIKKISIPKWTIFFNFLFILPMFVDYVIRYIRQTLDVGGFSTAVFFLILINICVVPFLIFREYFAFKKFKNKWSVSDSNFIEIQKEILKGIFDFGNKIQIQTNNNEFFIPKKYIEDLEQLNIDSLSPKPKEYLRAELIKKLWTPFLLLIIGITIFMLRSNYMEDYNFKYAIPSFQIKTIQLEVKYIEDATFVHHFSYRETVYKRYKVLINDSQEIITFVNDWHIGNKIFNENALNQLKPGSLIKIKVRTEDYQDFLKQKKFRKFPFYELEANGDILYQKRGLREDFEIATF